MGLTLKALGRRSDIHVSAMIVFPPGRLKKNPHNRWQEIIAEGVEERLRLLHTDRIDIFNIHMPEDSYSRGRLKTTLEAFDRLREQGSVGSIGASTREPRFLAELIRKYGCFDSVMVRYNYHIQEARKVIFPLSKAFDVGIVATKPFAWPHYGILLTHFRTSNRSADPASANLRWILSSSEVSTVVVGTNSPAELEENLAAITKEERIDERILRQCFEIAQGLRGKDRLKELLKHPATDIQGYAKTAL